MSQTITGKLLSAPHHDGIFHITCNDGIYSFILERIRLQDLVVISVDEKTARLVKAMLETHLTPVASPATGALLDVFPATVGEALEHPDDQT